MENNIRVNSCLKVAIKATMLGNVKPLNFLLKSKLVNVKSKVHLDWRHHFFFGLLELFRNVHDPCSCGSEGNIHIHSAKEVVRCFHHGTLLEIAAGYGQFRCVKLLF